VEPFVASAGPLGYLVVGLIMLLLGVVPDGSWILNAAVGYTEAARKNRKWEAEHPTSLRTRIQKTMSFTMRLTYLGIGTGLIIHAALLQW
jgi:hypothetical protein